VQLFVQCTVIVILVVDFLWFTEYVLQLSVI